MKSSKHVETCFVRANNDFDDKLTAFSMKNNFWTKIPKNRHCVKHCFSDQTHDIYFGRIRGKPYNCN